MERSSKKFDSLDDLAKELPAEHQEAILAIDASISVLKKYCSSILFAANIKGSNFGTAIISGQADNFVNLMIALQERILFELENEDEESTEN